jgi:hypothetical protein
MWSDRPNVPDTYADDSIVALSGAIVAGNAAIDAIRFDRNASLEALTEAIAAVKVLESIHASLWALEDAHYASSH